MIRTDRHIAAAALFALSLSTASASTPFVVRADESPEDSLITVEVGDAPFTLERTGPRQIDLVTPDMTRAFDISAVLALGGGRRLAAARTVADDEVNRLRLTLGCECAYGFSISGGRLSITLRAAEPEPAVAASPPRTRGSRFAPLRAPRPFARPRSAALAGEQALVTNSDAKPTDTAPPAPRNDVLAARQHLLQQLSRAADQGLLEFVSDDTEGAADDPERTAAASPEVAIDETQSNAAAQRAPKPKHAESAPLDTPSGQVDAAPLRPAPPTEAALRARTAIDKHFRADRADTLVPAAPCIPRGFLDLSGWSPVDDFVDRVPVLRGALLDDFDQPRPEIVRELARSYILNGFGVEAEALLAVFGADLPDGPTLLELARIVDGKSLTRGGPIAGTGPCHGPALLWRRAAGLPHANPGPSETIWLEMTEAFNDLPRALRELVAPQVLSSLVQEGEIKRAEDLDLILSRAPLKENPALDLARARLLAAGGDAVAAEKLYERLARRDAPEAHESLIRMLDSRLARGAPVSKALANALSDLAFATRGHSLELAAKTAEIRAHAATDGPMAALVAVRDAIGRTPEDAAVLRDAGHAALERLAPSVTDDVEAAINYTQAVTMYQPFVSTGRDGDAARRRVASELLRLGLANAALSYLEPAMARREPAVRLLAANTLIALDRPDDALRQLEDMSEPRAQELRAAALARSGDFEGAAKADPTDASRALSAGDWANAAQADGPRAALASYMAKGGAKDADAGDAEPTSLSGARAAQEAARATRTLIDEALTDG